VKHARGFTLLEMIVASTIMAIAVVGLLSGLATSTYNAARLQDHDRAAQFGRLQMNELLANRSLPLNVELQGMFPTISSGGVEGGWRGRITNAELGPAPIAGKECIQRVELEVWWTSGGKRRTFELEGYRVGVLREEDVPPPAAP